MLFIQACTVYQKAAGQQTVSMQPMTLVDGYLSMEYKYLEFKKMNGDIVYSNEFDSCLTDKGYVTIWDTGGPPSRPLAMFLHKKINVTFSVDSVFSPENENSMIMGIVIKKLELIK